MEPKLRDQEIASLMEIPHPSKGIGASIYRATKVFPDDQTEPGAADLGERLGGPGPRPAAPPPCLIVRAEADRDRLAAYRTLRRQAFLQQQGLFERDDGDEHDGAAHTIVLVAVAGAWPHAAKDASRAAVVGTAGMPAEASGCGAELEVAKARGHVASARPPGSSAGRPAE